MTRTAILAVLIAVVLLPSIIAAIIDPGDTTIHQLGAAPTSPDRLNSDFGPYIAGLHDRTPPTAPPTTTTTVRKSRHRTTVRAASIGVYPSDEMLDQLAYCETGGTMDPATNTGNGYYGAFQFTVDTWWSVGGEGWPHEHPYGVQRDLARTLILQAGWSQFPTCSRVIGAR